MTDSKSCCRLNRNDLFLAGLLALIVAAIFGTRLDTIPLHGEESRWARGAVLMMETGDWIVPRQQYRVFPERPPLNSWTMAWAAMWRGEFDEVAVRLPSTVGIVLTTLLIFFYSRQFLEPIGAIGAAGAYASMGQVLQIGRLGESESVFTLFVASSLLLWHWGYTRKWPPLTLWTVAYLAVGLGALTKGIQAPVYFASVIGVYLLIRRDWRTLLSWQHGAGILVMIVVVAAWQIPFLQRTQWSDTVAIWFGLVSDRVGTGGLLEHVIFYPSETLACLMPASLLLLLVGYRSVRQSLAQSSDLLTFVLVAVVVTYPSVLFSIGAKGRYFMPLYPCIAVILGMIIQAGVQSGRQSAAFRTWGICSGLLGMLSFFFAIAVASAGYISSLELIAIGGLESVAVVLMASVCGVVILWATQKPERATYSVLASVTILGVIYCGVMIPAKEKSRNDFATLVAAAKKEIPADQSLVSIGAADHRFCFYYRDSIPQVDWPETLSDVPEDVEYFCFHRRSTDTEKVRSEGRGRDWQKAPGTLPFAWEEITRVPYDSRIGKNRGNHIVIARRIRKPTNRAAQKQGSETNGVAVSNEAGRTVHR